MIIFLMSFDDGVSHLRSLESDVYEAFWTMLHLDLSNVYRKYYASRHKAKSKNATLIPLESRKIKRNKLIAPPSGHQGDRELTVITEFDESPVIPVCEKGTIEERRDTVLTCTLWDTILIQSLT